MAFSAVLTIPAGTTYYFAVRETLLRVVVRNGSSGTVTRARGDASYPAMATLMGQYTTVNTQPQNNFVWSPNCDYNNSDYRP